MFDSYGRSPVPLIIYPAEWFGWRRGFAVGIIKHQIVQFNTFIYLVEAFVPVDWTCLSGCHTSVACLSRLAASPMSVCWGLLSDLSDGCAAIFNSISDWSFLLLFLSCLLPWFWLGDWRDRHPSSPQNIVCVGMRNMACGWLATR